MYWVVGEQSVLGLMLGGSESFMFQDSYDSQDRMSDQRLSISLMIPKDTATVDCRCS